MPKSRLDIEQTLNNLQKETTKSIKCMLLNDETTRIIIFSNSNLDCLCNTVDEIFVDGTFKSCPKYFYQLYSVHSSKNGNYVPVLFVLLPSKSEEIVKLCQERNLILDLIAFTLTLY